METKELFIPIGESFTVTSTPTRTIIRYQTKSKNAPGEMNIPKNIDIPNGGMRKGDLIISNVALHTDRLIFDLFSRYGSFELMMGITPNTYLIRYEDIKCAEDAARYEDGREIGGQRIRTNVYDRIVEF